MAMRNLKAHSIGRFELLSWLNEFLSTDYSKIEHLADCIAYCQILDSLYPGKIPLHKLNFHAKFSSHFEKNNGVLIQAFHACSLKEPLKLSKLVEGKFQDNFEFLLWCYNLVQKTCPDVVGQYRAATRRTEAARKQTGRFIPLESNPNLVSNTYSILPGNRRPPPIESAEPIEFKALTQDIYPRVSSIRTLQPALVEEKEEISDLGINYEEIESMIAGMEAELTNRILSQRLLTDEITLLRKEREFYFDKLRAIERICEECDGIFVTSEIRETLSSSSTDFIQSETRRTRNTSKHSLF